MKVILELLPKRVFFQIRSDNPTSGIHMNERDGFIYHYHSMDSLYKSLRIRKYFGPMTLSNIHRHCALIDTNLKHTPGRHLFYTNGLETLCYQQKRTSAIFLMGCYLLLRQDFTPEQTKDALHEVTGSVAPFTDMEGSTAHALSLLDCWQALYHGMMVNRWFKKQNSVEVYKDMCDDNDDVNWVVPRRLLALEDPKEPRYMGRGPRVRYSVVEMFKQCKVETVVRLNGRDYEYRTGYGRPYDSEEFVCRAIKHYDIFFKDGGIPAESQLNTFLKIVRKAQNPVAVHCHAGRGRTGTMLACSLVRFWGFEAVHAIGWVRMCRAACVVGIQQGFVKMFENSLREKACISNPGHGGNRVVSVHTPTKSVRQIHLVPPPCVRKRPTRPNPTPAKIPHRNKGKTELPENSSEDSHRVGGAKDVLLPVSGALNGYQRRKLRTSVRPLKTKTTRVGHEATTRTNSRKSGQKTDRMKATKQMKTAEQESVNTSSVIKVSLNTNTQLRLSEVFDLNLLRNMRVFQEHEPRSQYLRANINDKISCYIAKPGNGFHQRKRHTVDAAKVAGIKTMLQLQGKTAKREQRDSKQKLSTAQDDLARIHSSKPQVKQSKSSIPFVKTRIKYSGYQPTFEHLTQLLTFDKDSKSPVSSCGKEYKIPLVPAEGSQKSPKIDKALSRNKVERRLAWDEQEKSPQCMKQASGGKVLCVHRNDSLLPNDFLEKHKQRFLASKTANCAGGNRQCQIKKSS